MIIGGSGSLSIIIPCFNGAQTISEAVKSAASEPLTVEILIIDDGSTDESVRVAERCGLGARVLTGPNRGVSAARNRGIAETKGEWIIFLDADDILITGTTQKRLETAAATAADVVVCDWREFADDGAIRTDGLVRSVDMVALTEDPEIACATHVWATTAALMYRRSLVEKIGGFRGDLPVVQDARFMFDAAYCGAKFARSSHLGAGYRISATSLSRRDPARFWRDCLLNGAQIEALWRQRGALSLGRLTALAEIYNGAAHGLFRAGDPAFRDALAALRAARLPVGRRNRLAEAMSDALGHRSALKIAEFWTSSRRATGRLARSFGATAAARQMRSAP